MTEDIRAYKRRNYFIDKGFQVKFIVRFCMLAALGGLLTTGIIYYLSMQSTTVAFFNSRAVVRSTADFMLPLLLQTVLVVMVITSLAMIAVTLFASHKIAGPMYRLKRVTESLAKGDFSSDFKIRKLDQFQDLAGAFNNMIAGLRTEITALKKNSASLKENLDNISEQDIAENKKAYLNELKRISGQLEKAADYFKT